jgi:hypothetical protein
MTTYLRLLYPQLLSDLLHSNATGSVCHKRTHALQQAGSLSDHLVAQEGAGRPAGNRASSSGRLFAGSGGAALLSRVDAHLTTFSS